MRRQNPLAFWWMAGSGFPRTKPRPIASVEKGLNDLEAELDNPSPKRNFMRISFFSRGLNQNAQLPPSQRKRAEALLRRLWSTPGTGKTLVEEALLGLLGSTADPDSIPILKEAVEQDRRNDRFTEQRRVFATAGLAFMVLQNESAEALGALLSLTTHESSIIRVAAVETLVETTSRMEPKDRRGAAIREALVSVATRDPAFEPRFLARNVLAGMGKKVPGASADGVYTFKVKYGRARRTIEVGADQTLFHLHFAILDAFDWDSDHLFAFYLSGKPDDPRFEFPDPGEHHNSFDYLDAIKKPNKNVATLAMLDMPAGHSFLYHYDFGDNHRFSVEIAAVRPTRAPRVKYPRMVESVGEAPSQYREW